MSFADWVAETKRRYEKDPPLVATRASVNAFTCGVVRRGLMAGRRVMDRRHSGEHVYERDWDVLVLLDTCRPDALKAVADDYDWLAAPEEIATTHSLGEMSESWMRESFTGDTGEQWADEMAGTAHVTWNAFSDFQLDDEDWLVLDEVWQDVWDNDLGCLPPEALTNRARDALTDVDAERYLVHYMQPHAPYRSIGGVERLDHSEVGEREAGRETIWDWLRGGKITREDAWEAYLDNLRWVLDDLPRLFEAIDDHQTVAISADHGECFGEWGIYGHPPGCELVPELTEVPFVEVDVSATTFSGDEPQGSTAEEWATNGEMDVEERLEALGYA